jgi:GNAT superfamily N-acetyltransferase
VTSVVQHRSPAARAAYREHLAKLPPHDIYLRFGAPMTPDALNAYVERIDFHNDVLFAIHDHDLSMVGAAHVAFGIDDAEFGVSVLPSHRRRGYGLALVERAAQHVRNRFYRRVYMHCLAQNEPIMRLARKAGMDIVLAMGEADAYLALPPANPLSVTQEAMRDRLALIDYALKTQVAALARMRHALAGKDGKA